MMNLINEVDSGLRRFGPGYFDLIVIDEAHRSVYAKYGAIFDYFDSLLVGLTATPKDEVDHNTYRLFHLEDGVPTDNYTLDEAVEAGYLVPPKGISVGTQFLRSGIRYDDLTEEEKDQWDALDWGEDGPPDEVGAEELNRFLFNEDTVDKVLETLMMQGYKVASGDRLGKTIVFAKSRARRVHREAIQPRLPRARRALRPRHHPRHAVRPVAHRRLLDQGQGTAHRDQHRHARHRHRRARGRQPRLLQDGPLEVEVLADDRPRHPAVPRPVRARRGQAATSSSSTSAATSSTSARTSPARRARSRSRSPSGCSRPGSAW